MATLSQQIAALEKVIDDEMPIAAVEFIILDPGRDGPEEYARKAQLIAAMEARGESIIVCDVVDSRGLSETR
jgi:hypothetical protein